MPLVQKHKNNIMEEKDPKYIINLNGREIIQTKIVQYEIGHIENGGIGLLVNTTKQKMSAQTPNEPEPRQEKDDIALFKYIHYAVTSEVERLNIHKQICNIVRLPKMQQICEALLELMKSQKILTTIDQSSMLAELRRLGMPSNIKGFSDQNFYSYYKTK